MKLTPWFPGHIKPVRKGVYRVVFWSEEYTSHCYWDGEFWRNSYCNADHKEAIYMAFVFKQNKNPKQQMPWRGVAK